MHESVGRSVRTTIKSLGNILPEDLQAAPHIRAIQKRNRTSKEIAESLLLPAGGSSLPSNPAASSGG
jgi:hypothetical protein